MAKELHHPERDQIELSAVLEALSEPTRREIVLRLLEQGEAPCQAFEGAAPKSNLSYHYARLRAAGVARTRIAGPYRMNLGQGRRSRGALPRPARRDRRRQPRQGRDGIGSGEAKAAKRGPYAKRAQKKPALIVRINFINQFLIS